ncbi:MAG: hypothetical protein COV96_02475 [Candidatus Zambryskibacteria bacterium CG11_big_fil_rev_8_21_14_0_20_42_18]|uniref:Uncharacterized protein n=1 Tax=Candidatus Zambryskibacteria bacterium CG_4_9_14_3_um_filter_42_15 TaxID=1975112 RepID=A0A2M7WSC0_9BACT|nr:MAG: hypothetical protein COV96_02475 [Candidatus Zambryskibacteria bacterium CG11_big_fil_rev_8_21_14_0_20_42_18]PJA32884.1 MAG: hypothetical protein CO185_01400 [Candidatus Zambryskibacteria bacterium CG_4_9_14_3_um_filter_42_15]
MEREKDGEKEEGKDNESDREETKISVKKIIFWVLAILFVIISVWYLFRFVVDFFDKGGGGGFETPQVQLN